MTPFPPATNGIWTSPAPTSTIWKRRGAGRSTPKKGWQYGGQTSFSLQRDWPRLSNLYLNGTFAWTHGTITHGESRTSNVTTKAGFGYSF